MLDINELLNQAFRVYQEKMELLDHLEREAPLVNMDLKVLREQRMYPVIRMIKQRILFLIKVKGIRSEKGKLMLGQKFL